MTMHDKYCSMTNRLNCHCEMWIKKIRAAPVMASWSYHINSRSSPSRMYLHQSLEKEVLILQADWGVCEAIPCTSTLETLSSSELHMGISRYKSKTVLPKFSQHFLQRFFCLQTTFCKVDPWIVSVGSFHALVWEPWRHSGRDRLLTYWPSG